MTQSPGSAEAKERFLKRKLASGELTATQLTAAAQQEQHARDVPTVSLPPPAGATVVAAIVTDKVVAPLILALEGGASRAIGFPGQEPVSSRDAAVDAAAGLAKHLGLAQHAVMLAGEMGADAPHADARVRLVIVWVAHATYAQYQPPAGAEWLSAAAMGSSPLARFAAAAWQRARSTCEPGVDVPSELVVGAAP